MRRALVIVLVAVIASVALPAAPAAAETTFSTKKNVVTVTIKVDVFAGKNVRTGPDGTPIDQYFKTVVENTWGAAFMNFPYKSCFLFELDLDFKLFDVNAKGRKGSHKIYVGTDTRGWKGVGWDGAPKETARNGDTGDGTRSFENDRKGDIPVNAPPTVVAHEFGHLLGLGDDRKDGAPKNGRDGTMMVGNADGVDVNVVQEIDQKLIDRIGDVLEHTKKGLPKCQEWTGTLRSEHSIPVTPCTFTWSGTFELGVVEDQVLGSATVSPDGRCPAYAGPVTISGTADDDGFTIGSDSYILAAGTRIEKTAPDRAEGMSEYHDAYNDLITTFEMECKKNCDEPVG